LDIGAPSVTERDGTYHLAFESGGAIGHGTSANGLDFFIDDEPLLEAGDDFDADGVGSPSFVATERGFDLYYQASDGQTTRIGRASGRNGTVDTRVAVLEPGTSCTDPGGDPEDCWDGSGVGTPEVRIATTAVGRTVYRLMYTGWRAAEAGIGFSASFDGTSFGRYEHNPIVDTEQVAESAPTNLRVEDGYLLFFSEISDDARGIALAENRSGVPSETF
jgi:hypothetical protein